MKCKTCGTYLSEGAMFCGECGSSVLAASAMSDTQRVDRLAPAAPREPGVPAPPPAVPAPPAAASVPPGGPAADRPAFTLVFSTGETAIVAGPGLVGRNPQPGDAEGGAQIVRIVDPQLSVSKTHLEFGVEGGVFWVGDRRSGNGTSILTADGRLERAVPGELYAVARGSRVIIGEQFFDVL